jgi:hypothetical protein
MNIPAVKIRRIIFLKNVYFQMKIFLQVFKKIINVLEKVQYLEQEVEEFVGKKTGKAYWLLEEMMTRNFCNWIPLKLRSRILSSRPGKRLFVRSRPY